ncbi:MAG: ATP-binding protein, partial [Bacteroidota bacterium]
QTHPDDMERLKSVLLDVMNNPGIPFPASFRAKHKMGHYIFMDGMVTNMLHVKSIRGIVSNLRDVTETRKAEEKLRQSEKIYKTIASSIPGSVICLMDKDYRYLLIEGDMLTQLGYSKEQLLGKRAVDVILGERFQEVLPLLQRVFKGISFTVEDARNGYDTLYSYVPLRDEGNNVFAAMIVVFNVTELKQAQRAVNELNISLETRIQERTQELEIVNKELESFSYSVAHDLRTPLRAVYGYATMLREDYSQALDEEGNRLIHDVEVHAKRMGTLIDDLLTFSRLGRKELQKSIVDMSQIMQMSFAEIKQANGFRGQINIGKLPPVLADSSLMKHVMINLIGNAIKYSSKKESPRIEIFSDKKNGHVIFSIKDNGVGFDMEYADKLFGVFQRLHSDEEFDGTGVGLAIVQRIIHRHGGRIWAESKVNEGATFHFSLPAVSQQITDSNINT